MPVYKLGVMNAFLFAACGRGDTAIVEHLLANNAVKAQVNCINDKSQSPLHVAVTHGRTAVARVLIEYGAAFELVDGNGVTPLAMASFQVCIMGTALVLRWRVFVVDVLMVRRCCAWVL